MSAGVPPAVQAVLVLSLGSSPSLLGAAQEAALPQLFFSVEFTGQHSCGDCAGPDLHALGKSQDLI